MIDVNGVPWGWLEKKKSVNCQVEGKNSKLILKSKV